MSEKQKISDREKEEDFIYLDSIEMGLVDNLENVTSPMILLGMIMAHFKSTNVAFNGYFERWEELETMLDSWPWEYSNESMELSQQRQQIAQLEEKLRSAREVINWYGDKFNWYPEIPGGDDHIMIKADLDNDRCAGLRARQWISENKEDE